MGSLAFEGVGLLDDGRIGAELVEQTANATTFYMMDMHESHQLVLNGKIYVLSGQRDTAAHLWNGWQAQRWYIKRIGLITSYLDGAMHCVPHLINVMQVED